MKPGDEITADSGQKFRVQALVAVQGAEGCTDPRCRRINGECAGYHCPRCGEPCSMMGHERCRDA